MYIYVYFARRQIERVTEWKNIVVMFYFDPHFSFNRLSFSKHTT